MLTMCDRVYSVYPQAPPFWWTYNSALTRTPGVISLCGSRSRNCTRADFKQPQFDSRLNYTRAVEKSLLNALWEKDAEFPLENCKVRGTARNIIDDVWRISSSFGALAQHHQQKTGKCVGYIDINYNFRIIQSTSWAPARSWTCLAEVRDAVASGSALALRCAWLSRLCVCVCNPHAAFVRHDALKSTLILYS